MYIRIATLALMTVGALAVSKFAKAQIADLKGQEPLTTLAGSEWGPDNGMDQFVQFLNDGDLAGHGGCNSYFGTYEQDGNKLKIGSLIMTKKLCPDVIGAEKAFISALETARGFEASFKEINILDENNEVALSMRRRDWD